MSGLFADLPAQVSLARQIKAVTREIAERRRVYARLVAIGKKTRAWADEEIEVMCAVLLTLERYRHLHEQPVDQWAIEAGGVFVGRVPHNLLLSGADMDRAIDEARR